MLECIINVMLITVLVFFPILILELLILLAVFIVDMGEDTVLDLIERLKKKP